MNKKFKDRNLGHFGEMLQLKNSKIYLMKGNIGRQSNKKGIFEYYSSTESNYLT